MTEQQFIQTKDISAKSAVKDVARKKAMTGVDLSSSAVGPRRVQNRFTHSYPSAMLSGVMLSMLACHPPRQWPSPALVGR